MFSFSAFRRSLALAAALPLALSLTGCATSRSELQISAPATTPAVSVQSGKTVYIRSVKDARVFEESPSNPSTPSLGFDSLKSPDASTIKQRAIARKRNGFGQAMGDILLDEGQTVEGMVGNAIKSAFGEAGYAVINNSADAKPDTLIVDARIDKFWAWMKPGFWALTLSADIATDVSVGSQAGDKKLGGTVSSHAEHSRQTAMEGNWIELYQEALATYSANLKALLSEIR